MSSNQIADTLFSIMHAYRVQMRASLQASEIGLNGMHVKCLSFIYENSPCTANDIVVILDRDKAQIARLVREMIEKEWLIKRANPADKRSQTLILTDSGTALAKLIIETRQAVHQRMVQHLSSEELTQFLYAAEKIIGNLSSKD